MSRQARSLDIFVDECNDFAPHRNKASDGGLASSSHHSQNPTSDHEPNRAGVWTARDTTNDVSGLGPIGGDDLPGQFLANRLDAKLGKHPAMMSGAYIIFNRRIKSYNRRNEGWRVYTGSNSHKTHVHLSVSDASSGYDSTAPWNLFKEEEKPVTANAVERTKSLLVEAVKVGRDIPEDREVATAQVAKVKEIVDNFPDK